MEFMSKLLNILFYLGTDKYVLGICSLCGIVGFCFTILIALKTKKIEKILHYNDVMEAYNKAADIYDLKTGQILLNHDDFQIRKRMNYLSNTLSGILFNNS